jgi:hypothetical protein
VLVSLVETARQKVSDPLEMPKAQGGVCGNSSLSIHNGRNSVCRHPKLSGQFCRAHAKLFKLLGEMFAWMYGVASHNSSQ